ncbi:202_t:CDS:2 [Rhizophagus irregularis]|nr:202_t:CDS:2 [Rhizophagus irregularis]
MVKRQHQRTSSLCCASIASTSAQIRKPAVTTRSRRSQNAEFEQQKLFAFDMKRKRRSNNETDTLEKDDEIDRRLSPSYSNSNIVDSIKLENNESVSSPSKRAKLSTMGEYNNNQFDIDNDVQSNVEIMGIKLENISTHNGVRRNSIHLESLQNGIESRDIVQPGIKNGIDNVDEIVNKIHKQEDCLIIEDIIYNNIEMIIDNFKDVIEIRGTQMVIGNFVIEYSDYQKFLTLMNKLMDILEMYDSDKILQSAKKIGCKRNNGQILNPNLFRTKISKRAYKCLSEFQDDFTCTCNDAIEANPEKYNAGIKFIKFGDRLFEQAYGELPSGIRQLCDHDDNFDATKGTSTKRHRKVALVQPTLDGHVFSIGDLQEIAVVPSQSMNEEEIPTLGSILPKNVNHEFELPMSDQHKVPGVKFHKYKAYASFAPIYDSSAAMLSYEDTILTRSYKKHLRISKNINELDDSDDSDLSEEELSDKDVVVSDPEETNQPESFEIASSSKQNNSGEETSQMEGLEITLPDKQNNLNEEMSQMEDLETTLLNKKYNSNEEMSQMENLENILPNKQNNSSVEVSQIEGLETTLPNKQNNSNEEISQTEGLETTLPNKQNNSSEEISQMEGLEITVLSNQNNSNEEMSQMEGLEATLPDKQNNSSEETSQMEGLETTLSNKQNNSNEEMSQMENLETTVPNKQNNSGIETSQMESLETTLPNKQNNSGEEISQMDSLKITSNTTNISGEKICQMESFEFASLSKQNDSRDDIFIENNTMDDEKLFENINLELLYKCVNNGKAGIDKILDENVEIFKKLQLMQEKRLTKHNPNVVSIKERELANKLRDKLASIISEVAPSDIVSFDSIEYTMDNLPTKEKFFKGMLPPDKSFAYHTNEVSRDAFSTFSGVEKSSEDMEAEYTRNDLNGATTQMKSEDVLSQVPHSVPQTISQQPLHHSTSSTSHSLPISASMTYPRAQVQMRMSYGTSQVMPTSYQTTYQRPTSHVLPYYHPSQRYPPTYGYPYYPQYGGYPMSHSAWQQRSSYFQ